MKVLLKFLKSLLFKDEDACILDKSHLARVIRAEKFHGVPDVGETGQVNRCVLVKQYSGKRERFQFQTTRQWTLSQ